MKQTSLVSTPVCIDLFGPVFCDEGLFGNVLDRLRTISSVVDPSKIYIFCGPPERKTTVGISLTFSDFFKKTGLLPECLIFSEQRPTEDFKVVISSDLQYLAGIEKRTIRILVGCRADILADFTENVILKITDDEPPKWDTLLTVSDWNQNFNIILDWLKNPEQVLNANQKK